MIVLIQFKAVLKNLAQNTLALGFARTLYRGIVILQCKEIAGNKKFIFDLSVFGGLRGLGLCQKHFHVI